MQTKKENKKLKSLKKKKNKLLINSNNKIPDLKNFSENSKIERSISQLILDNILYASIIKYGNTSENYLCEGYSNFMSKYFDVAYNLSLKNDIVEIYFDGKTDYTKFNHYFSKNEGDNLKSGDMKPLNINDYYNNVLVVLSSIFSEENIPVEHTKVIYLLKNILKNNKISNDLALDILDCIYSSGAYGTGYLHTYKEEQLIDIFKSVALSCNNFNPNRSKWFEYNNNVEKNYPKVIKFLENFQIFLEKDKLNKIIVENKEIKVNNLLNKI